MLCHIVWMQTHGHTNEIVQGYDNVPRTQAEPVGKEALVEGREALGAPRLQRKQTC